MHTHTHAHTGDPDTDFSIRMQCSAPQQEGGTLLVPV